MGNCVMKRIKRYGALSCAFDIDAEIVLEVPQIFACGNAVSRIFKKTLGQMWTSGTICW